MSIREMNYKVLMKTIKDTLALMKAISNGIVVSVWLCLMTQGRLWNAWLYEWWHKLKLEAYELKTQNDVFFLSPNYV